MQVENTKIEGLLRILPRVFRDERGKFMETYQYERYRKCGISEMFVQDNHSRSRKNVLRGLHFQSPHAQGKLVWVAEGVVFDVVVDLRRSSETYSQWLGFELDGRAHQQLYVPPGCAHGFCVTSEYADFVYKCTESYRPEHEHSLRWDDPSIAIRWPIECPLLSEKDAQARTLNEIHSGSETERLKSSKCGLVR